MINDRPQIKFWLIGLAMFAGLIALSIFRGDMSPYNIIDHQAAATAEMVDTIQASWRDNGIRKLMIASMIGDLVFIGVYGWGSYVAGRSLSRISAGPMRAIGVLVALAAVAFLITDYLETILQLIQMLRDQGSDWMAATAAFAQPIKIVAWITTFVGTIFGLIMHRFSRQGA